MTGICTNCVNGLFQCHKWQILLKGDGFTGMNLFSSMDHCLVSGHSTKDVDWICLSVRLCLRGCTWASCLTEIKFDNGLVHVFFTELTRTCVWSGHCQTLALSSTMHIQSVGSVKPSLPCPTCLLQTLISTRLETWKLQCHVLKCKSAFFHVSFIRYL